MAWNRNWNRSSWSDSSWQDNNTPGWNNWGRQQAPSQPVQPSVPANPVPAPQNFHPDSECCDTSVVSGKKFYRHIQSTPWPSKSGLAGKDVGQLRVTDLTRKGLDDYALRNLSNGKFQSADFVCSVSEAVFTTNLLRLIRQDRLDIDGIAAHLHGAAPPDKHRESARFMEPLLSEILQTLKRVAPVAKPTEQVNDEMERAKRKLPAAALELTPPAKRRQSQAAGPARASTDAPAPLPVATELSKLLPRSFFFQSSQRQAPVFSHVHYQRCHRQVAQGPPNTIQRASCGLQEACV